MPVPVVFEHPLVPAVGPPARIYVSGFEYKIAAPKVALPPLANTLKVLLNYSNTVGRIAKNIFYVLFPGGIDTTTVATLQSVADSIKTAWSTSNLKLDIASPWGLDSVTVRDNTGATSNVATSAGARIVGTGTTPALPPNSAVCLSWQIAASYRGGKSRSYLPGVSQSYLNFAYDSQLDPSHAATLQGHANSFMLALGAVTIPSSNMQAGCLSHFTGHAVRPVPIFRQWLAVKVHERLDSQRRRSGKEALFPTVP